jgi:ATP-binding cassette subfamily F protein uup
MANPNFLILDEPTNDLDIDTLNVLEDFLENYQGVLLLVSHDRYLIDKLTEQLFVLKETEEVSIFSGNYTEYRLQEQANKVPKQMVASKKEVQVSLPTKNKLSFKEEKELEGLEASIPSLEVDLTTLTSQLNSGISNHEELLEISKKIESLKAELEEKGLRWIELLEIKG